MTSEIKMVIQSESFKKWTSSKEDQAKLMMKQFSISSESIKKETSHIYIWLVFRSTVYNISIYLDLTCLNGQVFM